MIAQIGVSAHLAAQITQIVVSAHLVSQISQIGGKCLETAENSWKCPKMPTHIEATAAITRLRLVP